MPNFSGMSFRYKFSSGGMRQRPKLNYRIKVTEDGVECLYDTFTEIAKKYKVSLSSVLKKFNGGDVKKLSHLNLEKYYG